MADLKSYNGIAVANISKINGTALSSLKSFNGLTISTGWNNISGASYDSKSKNVSSQASNSKSPFFNTDGTKMYVGAYEYVYQYSLSTAWDVSTASYDSKRYKHGNDNTCYGLYFKSDGTKMYILIFGNRQVYQYSLSTAWDVSTASYDNKSYNLGGANMISLYFKSDGTKMYTYRPDNDAIYQYSLSTAWDVSTASYEKYKLTDYSYMSGITFGKSGEKVYLCSYVSDTIYQLSLSTAWDVSTLSDDSNSFSISSQTDYPKEFIFDTNGTKFYLVGGEVVYQYSL